MRKKFNLTVIFLTLLGCICLTNGLISAAPKEVKMSVIYAPGDPLNKQLIHEVIVKFMKAYPNVKIQEDLSISTGGYKDILVTKDAVGEFPDFVEMRDAPLFVRAGKLAPLPKELSGLFNTTIPIYGKVYTAPFTAMYPIGMFYNKKLFQENHWTEPKNYGQFLQLCDKMKAKGIAPMVAGIKDIWHMGYLFSMTWLDSVGMKNPNWIADRYNGKVHFTDKGFAAGMEQLVALFTKGYVEEGYLSTTEAQCPSILVSGKVAMYYSGPFVIQSIMDADPNFELGWFPLPDTNGKIYLTGGATKDGWALSANAAKDPQKVKAFVNFVKFFMNKENYTYYCKSANVFPTTKWTPQYEMSPVMNSIYKAYDKAPKALMWNQGVGANELPPSFRNWTYKKIQEMTLGLSVSDGLKQMDQEWDKEARDFNPTKSAPGTTK